MRLAVIAISVAVIGGLFGLLLLTLLGPVDATLSSCTTINESGTYALSDNLTGADQALPSPLTGNACILITASDVILDCDGYTIKNNETEGTAGIMLNASTTNITVQNCPEISNYSVGVLAYGSNGNHFENITASDNNGGFVMTNSTSNTLLNNNANNNSIYGFIISTGPPGIASDGNQVLMGNNASGNGAEAGSLVGGGFYLEYYNRNNLTGNRAFDNFGYGFCLNYSSNNTLTENVADDNDEDGFYILGSQVVVTSNSTFVSNTASNNDGNGFEIESDTSNTFESNEAYGNGLSGFRLSKNADNNTFNGDTIHSNGQMGFVILPTIDTPSTGTTISDCTLYNNSPYDFFVGKWWGTGSITYNMTNCIFTNPTGTMENYTNLSIYDAVASGQAYKIKWATNTSAVPENYESFDQKFIMITPDLESAATIDSITWHWLENETTGHAESMFGVWRYYGGWSDRGASLDTDANTLTLTDETLPDIYSGSIFGILENTESPCEEINESGTHTLTEDSGCFRVTSSDVVIDCDGYNITDGELGVSCGIEALGPVTNVTVVNCNVNGFDYGLCASGVTGLVFEDVNSNGNTQSGATLDNCNDVLFNDCHLDNNVFDGAQIEDSDNITINQSTFNGNGDNGLSLDTTTGFGCLGCTFSGNGGDGTSIAPGSSDLTFNQSTIFLGNGDNGLSLETGSQVTIEDSTMAGNGNNGLSITSLSTFVTITNILTLLNAYSGIYLGGSSDITVDPTYFCNNTIGILVNESENITVEDSVACNNDEHGVYVLNSNNITIDNSTAYGNNGTGIYFVSSSNSSLTDNIAYDNKAQAFELQEGSYNNLTNNTAYDNGDVGFRLNRTLNNNLIGNTVNNSQLGFLLEFSNHSTMSDNTVTYSEFYNIVLGGSNYNTLTNNTVSDSDYGFALLHHSDNNNLTDNTAYDHSERGFYLQNNSNYNTLTNNTAHDNPYAFELQESSYNNLTNNTAYDNGDVGFRLNRTLNNNLIGNTVNNSQLGFLLEFSNHSTMSDNTVTYSEFYNIVLGGSNYNTLTNNTASDSDYGFALLHHSDNNNLTDNTAYDHSERDFTFENNSNYNTLTDNTAYDAPIGFAFVESDHNVLIGNEAYENTDGFRLQLSDYNNLTGDEAHDNVWTGFDFEDSDYLSLEGLVSYENEIGFGFNATNYGYITDSVAHDNYEDGFVMVFGTINGFNFTNNRALDNDANGFAGGNGESSNALFFNNTAANNSEDGFLLIQTGDVYLIGNRLLENDGYGVYVEGTAGARIVLENNSARLNGQSGFGLEVAEALFFNNTADDNDESGFVFDALFGGYPVANNTASNNQEHGFYIAGFPTGVLANTTAYGNGLAGIYDRTPSGAGMTVENAHLYDNAYDYLVNTSTALNVTLVGVVFDNPAGNLTNYTNLSVSDVVESAYSIDWDSEPAPLPADYISFEGKFVNITELDGTVYIDSIVWHWLQNETAGHDESAFTLQKYNESGWTLLSDSPNTVANTLSLTDLSPLSTFAILEWTEAPPVIVDDDDEEPGPKPLSVSVVSTCDGNTITVTSRGAPLQGAKVVVKDTTLLETYTTGSDGKVTFPGCSMAVKIDVSKNGYDSESIAKTLIDCAVCLPECTEDDDCPADAYCDEGQCMPVICTCGEIVNHQCIEYECCDDTDCPEGQVCRDNECQPEELCETDADCAGGEYCDAGSCSIVTGACGYAEGHVWVEYECGVEPECPRCPEGTACVDNRCVRSSLTGPDDGFIGERVSLTATEDGKACAGCDVEITDPTGRKLTGRTDANGNIEIPLNIQGDYTVTLLRDGVPVASKGVAALTRPPLPEEKPLTTVIAEAISQFWLVLLLVLVALLLLYWRTKRKKKKRPKR